ncbi:unnamed protein product [Paramecium sonneborni]|uniref:Uncharacterized protein n=1 Tax=Paramecium sonneborni TaxID=65129 RepID=A0A8S1RL65_9CILI|nr:unnamed protein product [Paramecium sonneborni]
MNKGVRIRYSSLDESRTNTKRYQTVYTVTDSIRNQVNNLKFNHHPLSYYISRICKNIKEMRRYRTDAYIRNQLSKIYAQTIHLKEIHDVFKVPVQYISEDLILSRCTLQLISQMPHQYTLRPSQQLTHFMQWMAYFDDQVYLEMQKIHEGYLLQIQKNIQDQYTTNVIKQQQIKHQIHPKKKDMYNYVNRLITKPSFRTMSRISILENYETKFGEFQLITPYARSYAKQLDTISQNLNTIE